MKTFPKILPFFCLAVAASYALAEPKPNVDQNGIGLQGYDPVAFFTDGKPVLGDEKFHSTFNGVTYRFASVEHQKMFEKTPPSTSLSSAATAHTASQKASSAR
jgi:YHS domain-containing protein